MRLAHHALDRRAVAEIQERVAEKGGRNPLSRLVHAKNDKETIATWKSDLNKILHIFNVSFIISVWPLPTIHSQAELAINTHTMVTDIHRNVLRGQDGTDDQHPLVSEIYTPFHHRMNKQPPLSRHRPGQRSRLPMDPMSYICI